MNLLHRVKLLLPRLALPGFAFVFAWANQALAGNGPTVFSNTAALGITATSITLAGAGFDTTTPANNTVVFNDGAVGSVTSVLPFSLTVTFSTPPAGTGNLTAVVTTDGQSSGTPVQVATVVPVAQFTASSETINALAGAFSIPVTVTGNPILGNGVTPTDTVFAAGFTSPAGLVFDTAGNLYVSDNSTGTVSKVTPAGTVSTFASGFFMPSGLAFDAAGNLYVAYTDENQNGFVGMVTPGGTVSTFASGFTTPVALAFDSTGNLYVADYTTGTISKVTPAGAVSTFASGFVSPVGLTIDATGNLYVAADFMVQKVTPAGVVSLLYLLSTIPTAMTSDSAGNLYVASRTIGGSPLASGLVTMITPGSTEITLISNFSTPAGLAVDAAGNLYASLPNTLSINGHNVDKLIPTALVPYKFGGTAVFNQDFGGTTFSPLKLLNGQPTAFITGILSADCGVTPTLTITLGTSTSAVFGSPSVNTLTITEPPPSITPSTANLAIDNPSLTINGVFNPIAANNTVTFDDGAVGTVTFASSTTLSVQLTTLPASLGPLTATVTSNGLSTGAPAQVAEVVTDVTSSAAAQPLTANTLIINGAGFDPIAANNTVTFNDGAIGTVTAATPTQLTVTFSNLPTSTGGLTAVVTTDGVNIGAPVEVAIVEPTAQFSVAGETVDSATGTFSIAVTLTGNPTFAAGVSATSRTFAANFSSTGYLAFDSAGNLYAADTAAGTVTKVAPDGTAAVFASGFSSPTGLAFDSTGNLYVANFSGNTVSKVTPAGVVGTFASGLSGPVGLAFDTVGNLYVANTGTNSVCKVTPGGGVSTFATGFIEPGALAFDATGNLYVANQTNGTVSKVTPAGVVSTFVSGFGLFTTNLAGLAFDTAGNLYVSYTLQSLSIPVLGNGILSGGGGIIIGGGGNPPNGGVDMVTPAGAVSSFLGGIFSPNGLAFDSAGNLYVSKLDTDTSAEVDEYSPTLLVPYTADGSAVFGTDYYELTPSPLTFVNGQPTVNITGLLSPDAGATPTLTFTLGAATGAILGNPSTNTLTINEPAPSVIPSTASLSINATSVTIAGNFSPMPANDAVTFNDGAAGTVTAATATSVTVTFTTPPTSLGALTATVTSNGVGTGTPVQVATVVPGVTATGAAVALGANTLIITGVGFDPVAANNILTLSNGAVGTVTAATSTQLTVSLSHVPAAVGNIYAVVTTDGFSSVVPVAVATVEPTVRFTAGSETVNATDGTFSVAVTLNAPPTFDSGVAHAVSTFASGFSFSYDYQTTITFDSAGNLYVASPGDGTVSKVTPGGAISTFATGFDAPAILAFDPAGTLWVGDNGNGSISKVSPTGVITPFATDLSYIAGMTFDPQGNLYYSHYDEDADGLVTKVTPGGAKSTYASGFTGVQNIAFDSAGNLYVIDQAELLVHKVAPNGTVSTFASVTYPSGIAIDAAGNVYVSSYDQGIVTIITPGGVATTLASSLPLAQGLALDAAGNLYVAGIPDGVGTVSKVAAAVIAPFTLGGTAVDGTDYTGVTFGPLTFVNGQPTVFITGTLLPLPGASKTLTFTLGPPSGAVLGSNAVNTLTIAEPAIVQFSAATESVDASDGTVSVSVSVTGTPTPSFATGAVGSPSTFASGVSGSPFIVFDSAGNFYTSSLVANTITKVTPGGVVSTFLSGLNGPTGMAFDSAGNLYISIIGENSVIQVSPSGGSSTFASGFNIPLGLAFDTAGNLYVANNRANSVSKVAPNGTVSTFASGLPNATNLAFDSNGNLYVDGSGGTISKVASTGVVSTFASGFSVPAGLAIDFANNLYVADFQTGTVSQITPSGAIRAIASGLSTPDGLAFDSAGNLYADTSLSGQSTNVTEVTPLMTVPFTFTGTTNLGDFTGITASPLVFAPGQTTAAISLTLHPDPGIARTLTFTLGTPSGAVLGNNAVNTMTIVNPPLITSGTTTLVENSATLTINGAGFDSIAAHNIVTFNDGAIGTVTAATATQLTVQFSQDPTSLGNLTATVSTDGQSSGSPVQVATVAAGVPTLPPWGAPVLFGTLLFLAGSRLPRQRAISGE